MIIVIYKFIKGITMKLILIFLYLLFLCSGLLTYLLNPGVIYKSSKKGSKIYCKECDFNYPFHKNLKHCSSCGVCIVGIDHHCGVFGKCIAKYNIFWFYSFIILSFFSIFSSIGILVYALSQLPI